MPVNKPFTTGILHCCNLENKYIKLRKPAFTHIISKCTVIKLSFQMYIDPLGKKESIH